MEGSNVTRGRGKPRKTIGETVKRDLHVDSLTINTIYDRVLWYRLIYVIDPILWEKT